jgi:hypothetical protein
VIGIEKRKSKFDTKRKENHVLKQNKKIEEVSKEK